MRNKDISLTQTFHQTDGPLGATWVERELFTLDIVGMMKLIVIYEAQICSTRLFHRNAMIHVDGCTILKLKSTLRGKLHAQN